MSDQSADGLVQVAKFYTTLSVLTAASTALLTMGLVAGWSLATVGAVFGLAGCVIWHARMFTRLKRGEIA